MRYLRMLSNSVVVAMLTSAYVVTLVVQLNPTLPLHPLRLAPIVTTVGLFYAVHLTVIFYLLLVLRQLFARPVASLRLALCSEFLTDGLRHDKRSNPVDRRSHPADKRNITSTPSNGYELVMS